MKKDNPPKKILEQDRLQLELLQTKKQLAHSKAEKAIVENNLAESEYKLAVMHIYVKYGLTMQDSLQQDGTIVLASEKDEKEVE